RLFMGSLPIAMVPLARLPETFCRSSPIMNPKQQPFASSETSNAAKVV
ncbi:hypothetical protein AVEN_39923-1, partial [Araneus ventricosus]